MSVHDHEKHGSDLVGELLGELQPNIGIGNETFRGITVPRQIVDDGHGGVIRELGGDKNGDIANGGIVQGIVGQHLAVKVEDFEMGGAGVDCEW